MSISARIVTLGEHYITLHYITLVVVVQSLFPQWDTAVIQPGRQERGSAQVTTPSLPRKDRTGMGTRWVRKTQRHVRVGKGAGVPAEDEDGPAWFRPVLARSVAPVFPAPPTPCHRRTYGLGVVSSSSNSMLPSLMAMALLPCARIPPARARV